MELKVSISNGNSYRIELLSPAGPIYDWVTFGLFERWRLARAIRRAKARAETAAQAQQDSAKVMQKTSEVNDRLHEMGLQSRRECKDGK